MKDNTLFAAKAFGLILAAILVIATGVRIAMIMPL